MGGEKEERRKKLCNNRKFSYLVDIQWGVARLGPGGEARGAAGLVSDC